MTCSDCFAIAMATTMAAKGARGARDSLRLARGLAEQRAGDDQALDLAGALVDLGDLGVAVVALDRELLGVAVAAEDLDRLAGDLAGDARRRTAWPARPRRCAGGRPPSAAPPARSARGRPRSRSACRRASAGSPGGRRSACRTCAAPGRRRWRASSAAWAMPDGLRGDADAAAVERRQRDPHAAAGPPSRSPGVSSKARSAVEEECRPELLLLARDAEARRRRGARRSALALVGVLARRRGTSWACEPLVIHCLVPVIRPSVGGARAASRRRRCRCPARSARRRRSRGPGPAAARARCAARRSRGRSAAACTALVWTATVTPTPGVAARELLEHEHVGEEVRAGAAELGRHADAHQPELAELREDLLGERVVAVPRRRAAGAMTSSAKRRASVADLPLLVGELGRLIAARHGHPPRADRAAARGRRGEHRGADLQPAAERLEAHARPSPPRARPARARGRG